MQRPTYQLPPLEPAPVVTLREAASEWAGREVLADEVSGRVDANALAESRPYLVEVRDRRRKVSRHIVVAEKFSEAWKAAANLYGLKAINLVRPA